MAFMELGRSVNKYRESDKVNESVNHFSLKATHTTFLAVPPPATSDPAIPPPPPPPL
ncbi:unnamed protein product [Lupinus luteus]|uniref:Uncharacterized protein n=1 Tax=Lupinus luteus TaxID=3873 RepID=A0AAV1WKJ1_LUPLU